MAKYLESFLTDESGQGFTEYALVLALVAVGLIAVLGLLRDELGQLFDEIILEIRGTGPEQYQSGT